MKVVQKPFGEKDNKIVHSFTLRNKHGVEISCLDYGCIINKIMAPDKNGNFENIVLGYDSLEEYVEDSSFFGAVIGRVAGRIKSGSFELDGQTYTLAKNENINHLHGGHKGFDKVVWDTTAFENEKEAGVVFTYLSHDGEEGYPGNVKITVTYTLNNDNELTIHYSGATDAKTLLNMTNHTYFNLSGNLKRNILDHTLKINSDQFLELNQELLPTGKLIDVKDTTFDFNTERKIETGTKSNHPQNKLAGEGYDHPFVLKSNHDNDIVLKDAESGRTLIIETDEVGVVVYTGNQLKPKGEIRGVKSSKYLGVCLETQGLPDAIHHSHFPSWVLDKGQPYNSVTRYKFGI